MKGNMKNCEASVAYRKRLTRLFYGGLNEKILASVNSSMSGSIIGCASMRKT
jgi:hypothetical protein